MARVIQQLQNEVKKLTSDKVDLLRETVVRELYPPPSLKYDTYVSIGSKKGEHGIETKGNGDQFRNKRNERGAQELEIESDVPAEQAADYRRIVVVVRETVASSQVLFIVIIFRR